MKKKYYVLAFQFTNGTTSAKRWFSEHEKYGTSHKKDTVTKKFDTKKEAEKYASENGLYACLVESLGS